MTMTVQDLKLDHLVIDDEIDFRTDKEAGLEELAASIKEHGLLQPIIVSSANGDGEYHVIAGRRRLRAFQHLMLPTIPAIVRDDMDDDQARVIGQIIENLQRQDVSAMDEARAFAQLGDYGMKQKDIAATLGVSPAHVSGRLALLKLDPKIVAKVEKGTISAGVATKLARLPKAVRDQAANEHTVDERTVARLESTHKEQSVRRAVVEALINEGIPAAAKADAYGYVSPDAMAEEIGLTDEDKPKTHEWTVGQYLHRSEFESDADLVAAVQSVKPIGAYVTGTPNSLKVTVLTSANLDKARKREQEERAKEMEERQAEAQRKQSVFDTALAPIIAAPDKAKILLALLFNEIYDRLNQGYRLGEIVTRAFERLGIEDTTTDLEDAQALLLDHARKSATDAMRVMLALSDGLDEILLQQGIDIEVAEYAQPYYQVQWYRQGLITIDQLSDHARQQVEREDAAAARTEEEAEADYEATFEARLEQALLAKMAEDGLNPDDYEDWPYSTEEIDAVEATVRAALDAEVEAE